LELLKTSTSNRSARSEFFNFEPVPVAVDLDGDGVDEIIVPQNQLEGHMGIVFRGPAGYRFQSVNSGFEGIITALGAIPGENPPSIIAAVVRFNTFLKSSGDRGESGRAHTPCPVPAPTPQPPSPSAPRFPPHRKRPANTPPRKPTGAHPPPPPSPVPTRDPR